MRHHLARTAALRRVRLLSRRQISRFSRLERREGAVVVHGGEAGARTKKKLKVDAAALATLDELLDAVRSELPPPKGRRADLGRVRVTIEDAEGGTIEVEDDGDMADAADARCVHVRGWPL